MGLNWGSGHRWLQAFEGSSPPLSMVPESFTGEPAFPFGEGPTSDEKGPTFQRVPDPGGTGA